MMEKGMYPPKKKGGRESPALIVFVILAAPIGRSCPDKINR